MCFLQQSGFGFFFLLYSKLSGYGLSERSRIRALSFLFLASVAHLFSCSVLPPIIKVLLYFRQHILIQGRKKGKIVAAMSVPGIRREQSLVQLPQARSLLSHWMVLYHMAVLAAKDIGMLGVSHFSDSIVEGRQGRSWEWVLRWLNNSFLLQRCAGSLDWNVFGEVNFLGFPWMRRPQSESQEVLLASGLPLSYFHWWRP